MKYPGVERITPSSLIGLFKDEKYATEPKSIIFPLPVRSIMILPGFKSLCMNFSSWRNESPIAIDSKTLKRLAYPNFASYKFSG
jgi:hypothetical protein